MGKKILYLLTCLLLSCGIFFALMMLQVPVQSILIKPAVQIVSLFSGTRPVCENEVTYVFSSLNITIDGSCAGSNFLLLCFLLISAILYNMQRSRYYLLFPFISLITAALSTPLVNSLRILVATVIQYLSNLFLTPRPHYLIHQTTGILVNLLILYLIYYFSKHFKNRLITNTVNHAHSA